MAIVLILVFEIENLHASLRAGDHMGEALQVCASLDSSMLLACTPQLIEAPMRSSTHNHFPAAANVGRSARS
jgi:hypothetical protein